MPDNTPWHPDIMTKLMGKIDSLEEKISNLEKEIAKHSAAMGRDYVQKAEFKPVKAIVYGMVTLVLLTVFGAMLKIIITPAYQPASTSAEGRR